MNRRQLNGRNVWSRRAFTVVELLVAAAITAVLAALLITITTTVLGSWDRSRSGLVANNQAKIALDQIAADLEAAVFRLDGRVWLAATVEEDQSGQGDSGATFAVWSYPAQGTPKPNALGTNGSLEFEPAGFTVPAAQQPFEGYRFGMAGLWLRFFTVEPDRNNDVGNLSAPRAVGYQIVRCRLGAGASASVQYRLFRSWVRPDSSFVEGFSLFESTTTAGSPSAYNNGNGSEGAPGSLRRPNETYELAADVVDFGIRFWSRSATGERILLFPTGPTNLGFAARSGTPVSGGADSVPLAPAGRVPDFSQMTYGFPDEADVFIRVIDGDAVGTLQAIERGDIVGVDWWEWVESNSKVFTRTVRMSGRPAL